MRDEVNARQHLLHPLSLLRALPHGRATAALDFDTRRFVGYRADFVKKSWQLGFKLGASHG
jgi:hypothetical protein